MPVGYLVTLGDDNLNAGDAISGGTITFTSVLAIGPGQWSWSGTYSGTTYTNEVEPGQYWLADDGNVYFTPDYGVVDTLSSASTISAPAYSAPDGVINGTSGNDDISAGYIDANGDAVDGWDGNNDTILFGDGNDTVSAGAGDDFIGSWSEGSGTNTLYGDAGNDSIIGGSGDDSIYGGTGDDWLTGARGTDNIFAGDGSDEIWVTDDHNTVHVTGGEGGTDWDVLGFANYISTQGVSVTFSGYESGSYAFIGTSTSGNFNQIEEILTTEYNDVIDASASNQDLVVKANGGNDTVTGGSGADEIYGGAGNDTLSGGAGDDVFAYSDGSGNDTVTDFDMGDSNSDGFTNDQLDVSELTDEFGNPVNTDDVTVTDDGSGNAVLTFPNGESVTLTGITPASVTSAALVSMGVPCFRSGTLIRTPTGDRPVESLRPGDMVTTLTSGAKPVRWIASSDLGDGTAPLPENAMPVRIRTGTMGNRHPLIVSPQHCILMRGKKNGSNVYVRAKHLAQETRLASFARGHKRVTYVHVLLDRHATLISNDIPSESFYPGPIALKMLPILERLKLYALIPDLLTTSVEHAYGPRAAPVLTRKELRLMTNAGTLACLTAGVVDA